MSKKPQEDGRGGEGGTVYNIEGEVGSIPPYPTFIPPGPKSYFAIFWTVKKTEKKRKKNLDPLQEKKFKEFFSYPHKFFFSLWRWCTIHIGREFQCLPNDGFLYTHKKIKKKFGASRWGSVIN